MFIPKYFFKTSLCDKNGSVTTSGAVVAPMKPTPEEGKQAISPVKDIPLYKLELDIEEWA